jgi:hypothetical protein
MEVIRVIKNKNYTTISNQLFKNKGISLKAKGLMAYLLSLPNDWDLSINGIVSTSMEGRGSIGNIFKELIAAGYIERIQIRDKGKFVGYDYFVFEQPKPNKPITDKPITENSIQISKEVIKERINKTTLSISENFKYEVFSCNYSKSMLESFYDYWSEPKSKTNKRMRWQYQPTFEIGRRLKIWAKREKGFNPKQTMSKIDMHLQSQREAEQLLEKYQIKNKTQ